MTVRRVCPYIHPPNPQNPVAYLAFHHTVFICATHYIIHHGLHARINLFNKMMVAGIHIIIVNGQEPIKSVIHNGVGMARYRIFPT